MANNKSISVGFRIPSELYERIEAYGKENNPRGQGNYDKTATLLELIEKGLNPDNQESYSQVSGDERKGLRDELFADMKEFLSYRLKAFKAEVLDSVKQNVKQDNTASTQLLDTVKQDVEQMVRLAIIQEKESIKQVIEDDGTIRRIILEIADIYLQLKDLKKSVSLSSNSVKQSVEQSSNSLSVSNTIKSEILEGFNDLPLQEKRKKINILSRKFPTIKNRIKEVLSERKNKPTRFNYSALNSKECIIIYKEFTGDNHANGSK